MLVKVQNLKKLFPVRKGFFSRGVDYVHAVDEVSFEIARGRIFGLVGESGCGKTTCGKLLVRLLDSTSGSIYLEDRDIAGLEGKELKEFRKNVQMIFQDPYESLNPRFTIFDTIAEPLVIQNIGTFEERVEAVTKALNVVDLKPPEDFLFRFPHELSGGQRQRVAIARALVVEPKFIVADEPVSMLDASIGAGIMNLMLELRDKFNLTYVFITHDLAVGRYICDSIAVMYLGKIVEMAPKEEIINDPKHPYTEALLSAVPVPDPRVKKERVLLKGEVPSPLSPPTGCRFHTRCPYKMEICSREEPKLKEIKKGHLVACHLHT
ncbi:MAG: ABC transporter ATP-binding protein [Candidatus Hydrothermarchaeales archaeon]